jgi:thiol-disulfide isomerase/thioredoxin
MIFYINCCCSQTVPDFSGSETNLYLSEMQDFIQNNESIKATDSVKRQNLYNELRSFIIKHPANEIDFLFISWGINLTYQQVKELTGFVDSSLQNSGSRSWADNTLNRISVAETGKPFPSLTLTDTSGNELYLSGLKGKVVLIDVWSSWCGPCREQIPDLRKLYKKYNSKGLEIIGISMDDNKQSWLKAIRQDRQTWKAYCELTNWRNNKFAARFYTYAIPANFLIDRNGILVGQQLSIDALYSLIAQHF